MNRLKLFTILVFTVLLSACATGSRAERRHPDFGEPEHTFPCEGPITSIHAYAVIIEYTQSKPGSRPSVVVEAGSDWDGLRLNQEGTVFTVTRNPKKKQNINASDVIIHISTPSLVEVKTGSGADFSVTGKLKAESQLQLKASSGSNICIPQLLANKDLTCDASSDATISITEFTGTTVAVAGSSGADINLNGKCRNLSIVGSSGAVIDMKATAKNANVSASSAANVTVKGSVSDRAVASASSSAEVDISELETESLSLDCTSGATLLYRNSNRNIETIHTSSGGIIVPGKTVHNSSRSNARSIEETEEEEEDVPVERTQPIKP